MARRIGILGGTFDPIHQGHLDAADAAMRALGLTGLYVMTANIPPHRPQPFASSYHRFAMAALAVAGRAGWRASDMELLEQAPSYTSATLKRFHACGHAASELFFITGADAFAEIATWKDYPAILDAAHFAVVSRAGNPASDLPRRLPGLARRMTAAPGSERPPAGPTIFLIDAATADVSSTAIRRRVAEGQSIAGMVPVAVQQHIEQHGLYTSMTPDRGATDARGGGAAGRLHGQD
ncbi:MAG: nicotinate-nucleotide adenylyltransferase [Betaproteobacteria bacterium]